MCNFIEWKDGKIIYRRYASLCFVCYVDNDDNELMHLEIIQQFVEVLDRYFGNVCELDLIFNFHRAYFILDELLIGTFETTTYSSEPVNKFSYFDFWSPAPKSHLFLLVFFFYFLL